MEYKEVHEKLVSVKKDENLEDIEIEDGSVGLTWTEYVDIEVNGMMYLVTSIIAKQYENLIEIYGALGVKAFDLEEIQELEIDV